MDAGRMRWLLAIAIAGMACDGSGKSNGQGGAGGGSGGAISAGGAGGSSATGGSPGGGASGSGVSGTGGSSGRGVCGVTCAAANAECGWLHVEGCSLTTECGTCPEPQMCGLDGVANRCGMPGRWTVVAKGGSDSLSLAFDMNGLWGTSARDVWAVDRYGQVHNYDGASWAIAARIGTPLYGIHGTGALNFWVVGKNRTVLRLDGDALVTVPNTFSNPVAVWVVGADDAWVADDWAVHHWKAGAWVDADAFDQDGILGLWGARTGEIFAVGREGTFARRTGGAWQTITSGNTQVTFKAVWGTDANHVWAGGTVIGRWDGRNWRVVEDGLPLASVQALWGASATDVWAAGTRGLLMHGDGEDFEALRSPTVESIYALWGSASKDVWAAGAGGMLLHYVPEP
jgi:hypothetical protein